MKSEMELPDIRASFCNEFRGVASLPISAKELDQILALGGGKKTKDSLTCAHVLKQQSGWIHFWVSLRRRRKADETADFGIGVHDIEPPQDGRERKSRGLIVLLKRVQELTTEPRFRFSAVFIFPKDRFRTIVSFPDSAPMGLTVQGGFQVRVAGLRFVFTAAPLESLIIDTDEHNIYVSSIMNVKARTNDKLISECFTQVSQFVRTLILENA